MGGRPPAVISPRLGVPRPAPAPGAGSWDGRTAIPAARRAPAGRASPPSLPVPVLDLQLGLAARAGIRHEVNHLRFHGRLRWKLSISADPGSAYPKSNPKSKTGGRNPNSPAPFRHPDPARRMRIDRAGAARGVDTRRTPRDSNGPGDRSWPSSFDPTASPIGRRCAS